MAKSSSQSRAMPASAGAVTASGKASKGSRTTESQRANLSLSVARVKSALKAHGTTERMSAKTAFIVTGAVESLVQKAIEAAVASRANATPSGKSGKISITTAHFLSAINSDPTLKAAFQNFTFTSLKTVPNFTNWTLSAAQKQARKKALGAKKKSKAN